MPTNPLFSRLENFFSSYEETAASTNISPSKSLEGWRWECDNDAKFTSCSAEIEEILNIPEINIIGQTLHSFAVSKDSVDKLKSALLGDTFPIDTDVNYISANGNLLKTRVQIFSPLHADGKRIGWRGYTQLLSEEVFNSSAKPLDDPLSILQSRISKPIQPDEAAQPASPLQAMKKKTGLLPQLTKISPPVQWNETGNIIHKTGSDTGSSGATLSQPVKIGDSVSGVLKILDTNPNRKWSKENQLLVQEVAAQLSLALENAQLYSAVQRELGDRVRAEKETLKRNQDLASLNQIGQQLNALTNSEDIFAYLEDIILQLISAPNLTIAVLDDEGNNITFPVSIINHAPAFQQARPLSSGPISYILDFRQPLLINSRNEYHQYLSSENAVSNPPHSLLAVPMIVSEKSYGVILMENFESENQFSEVDLELLSTIATQAATSLENAYLFKEMSDALTTVEIRSRYQEFAAKGVAILTEFGTKSLPEFLEMLGKASNASRVYFAEIQTDEAGQYWHAVASWQDESISSKVPDDKIIHIPIALYEHWKIDLLEHGLSVGTASSLPSPERVLLEAQNILSSLLLAVPGQNQIPSFIGFDQLDSAREWQYEEIYALQVAANALSNTLAREDLLDQLQVSLDETEQLYNTSHRLALANSFQDMIAALTQDIKNSNINRGALITFEYDQQGKPTSMQVTANWHNGKGSPPPPMGSNLDPEIFHRYFLTPAPNYYDEINALHLGEKAREHFNALNLGSLAVLPLWVSKKQIGSLILASDESHKFSAREKRTFPPLVDQMAIAVENQRLFHQTEEALSDTATLYNISNEIAQASMLSDHLKIIGESLMPSEANQVSIVLVSERIGDRIEEVTVAGVYNRETGYRETSLVIKATELPIVSAIKTNTLTIPDVRNSDLDPESMKTLLNSKLESTCWIPMRSAGELMGFINVSAEFPAEFPGDDIRIIEAAANGIAVALERQNFVVEAERRALELQTAAELARDTTGELTLDILLPRFINLLCERFNFQNASIYLLDESNEFISIRESTSGTLKQTASLAVGSESLVGQSTAQGKPMLLNNILEAPFEFHKTILPETRSELCIPMKLGERIIGVLDIQSTRFGAFTENDITVLQVLADQIAIAMENARSYELSQLAIKEMEEVDRLKSQFLANMSHELRTPLNSIIGFSRVILKGIDGEINDIQKQDLSAIYNSGQHLLYLINDILDLSKIEAGKMQLSFTDLDINEIVNSVMSTAVGLVKGKPIKLEKNIEDDIPIVTADATRVRQVLLNFVSNSAKFTEEGHIRVSAFQSKSPDGVPELRVEVDDSGIGIGEEDQAKLFQAFSQVDDSPTRATGGTGLGLSISRSFIELHGGRIGISRSEEGKGSTFFFTLPTGKHDNPEKETIHDEGKEKIQKHTILSIDDEKQIAQLYQRYLDDSSYEVIPLSNPKLAVEKAIELNPMAITLDVMMPEKDGWSVLKDLKENPKTAHIPVIICSILEEKQKGLNRGASAYLVKPFLRDDFIHVIDQIRTKNG
jgi:K+-sensing histidine kinase KdpD